MIGSLLLFLTPVQSPDTHLYTVSDGSPFGYGTQVAAAGDVNADGHDDWVVANRSDDTAATNAGRVWVYSGYDGSLLHDFSGALEWEFGSSVDGAGDVNGDGHADIIVGAWHAFGGGSMTGAARVFSGADGAVLHTFSGPSNASGYGWAVSGAGDVNADGFADLIVGAYLDDRPGMSQFDNAGGARVYSGVDGSILHEFFGDQSSDQLGLSVDGLGDVDLDGYDDVVLGSRFANAAGQPFGNGVGLARVYSGQHGTVLYSLYGTDIFEEHGMAVAAAGDVDGDGHPDILVGAPRVVPSPIDPHPGSVHVYSGADGSQLFEFTGPSIGSRFGRSVSSAGDVDGDGHADVLGGSEAADSPTVMNAGLARLYSGATGEPMRTWYGTETGQYFGHPVAGGLDVNADGVPDVILGAPHSGALGGTAKVQVHSGDTLLLATDRHSIDMAAGGCQEFLVTAGAARANADFVVLGSLSGTSPGTIFDGVPIPLNADRYFLYSTNPPGARLLVGTQGTLDANGSGLARFVMPPAHLPGLVGLTFHHAALVFGPSRPQAVSAAAPLTLLP